MATFGAVEYRGDPWNEGASPYVNAATQVQITEQTDHALYLLYWNLVIGGTPIPQDVHDLALVEWERRYPFGCSQTDSWEWWAEWMNDVVNRRHGIYTKSA